MGRNNATHVHILYLRFFPVNIFVTSTCLSKRGGVAFSRTELRPNGIAFVRILSFPCFVYVCMHLVNFSFKNWLELDKPVLDQSQDLPKGSQPIKVFFAFK